MEYGTLGPSGIRVSRLALATSGFGTSVDEPTARQLLQAFVASGGTLIDAADVYADGTCEIWVGRWLQDHPEIRSRVVLLTKGRSPVRGQPGASLSPRYLRGALDASLRRLQVDQVDVYQVHGPDRARLPRGPRRVLRGDRRARARFGPWASATFRAGS